MQTQSGKQRNWLTRLPQHCCSHLQQLALVAQQKPRAHQEDTGQQQLADKTKPRFHPVGVHKRGKAAVELQIQPLEPRCPVAAIPSLMQGTAVASTSAERIEF